MADTESGPLTPEEMLTAGNDMKDAGLKLMTVARAAAANGWPTLTVGYAKVYATTVKKLVRFAESAEKSLGKAGLAAELAALPKNVGTAPKEMGKDAQQRKSTPRQKTSK